MTKLCIDNISSGKRRLLCLAAACILVLQASCASPTLNKQAVGPSPPVHHEFISLPGHQEKKIEFFWARPEGEGPWPALLYIHGHQEGDRSGGKELSGLLQRMANKNVVALSVSQPGYGQSDGPPDYCGPYTQDAVLGIIQKARTWKFVRSEKIGLYGTSRGAIVASMVAARDSHLGAVVLVSGIYDLEKSYKALLDPREDELIGIASNIRDESGATSDAFKERSAILHVKAIKTPILLLNGAKDGRIDPRSIQQFGKALQDNGTPAKVFIFPEQGHFIPFPERNARIRPFLKEYLDIDY